jgi:hypothetical protein
MRNVLRLAVLAACTAVLGAAPASKGDIDVEALLKETQHMSQADRGMTLAWWLPEEFWSASFARNPSITTSQAEEFLNVVRPHTMVLVIDGAIGVFGGITYKSEDSIRAITRLLDSQGKSYAPRTEAEVDADTRNLLQMMKPIIANMLGPMGENTHFLLFPGKSDDGAQIANAKGKGHFKVIVGEKEFKWRLPLDALLPAWVCSACKEECKGSWSFCPWCGTQVAKGN